MTATASAPAGTPPPAHRGRARFRRTRRPRHPRRLGVLRLRLVVTALLLFLAVAAALVVMAVAAALGLWSAGVVFSGGTATAGDLRVSTGPATWQQVTPGAPTTAPQQLTGTPEFWSMPGDIIEIRVPVTTYLRGDNLGADLLVSYAAPASPGDVAVSYHVENPAAAQVAPDSGDAPAGTPLTVAGLLGDNAGVTAQWAVVLRVEVLGDYRWVTPAVAGPSPTWTFGAVRAALNQVRVPGGGA